MGERSGGGVMGGKVVGECIRKHRDVNMHATDFALRHHSGGGHALCVTRNIVYSR